MAREKCERERRSEKEERIHCKDITTTSTPPTELEGLKEEKDHF